MSKRVKVLFFVMTLLLIGAIAAVVYFVDGYLKLKVAKFEVEQSFQQLKNTYALTKEELKSRDRKIEELKNQLNKYKRKVEQLREEIDSLRDDKEELSDELEKLKEQFADIDTTLEKKDAHIWRLKKELMRTRYRLFSIEQYIRNELKKQNKKAAKKIPVASTNKTNNGEKVITLGKIVVGENNIPVLSSKKPSIAGKGFSGSVLSLNRKYNFIIVALSQQIYPGSGWEVTVKTEDGKVFNSTVDTARRNMITMDIPKDLDLTIGDKVLVIFKNKI